MRHRARAAATAKENLKFGWRCGFTLFSRRSQQAQSAAENGAPAEIRNGFSPWQPGLFRRTHVGVGFDVAPLLLHNATQLALHGFKCVVDDLFERFVSAVIHLPFIGHKLVPRRHGHIDPASVWIPFVMVVIGLLDCDIAAVDVITKSLESFCIIQNEIVDLVRFFQTPIQYLNRQLHNYLDTTALFAGEGTKNLGSSIPFKFAATIGNG